MIVKEIVERPSSSQPPAPPQPPKPSAHKAGFPIAKRRAPLTTREPIASSSRGTAGPSSGSGSRGTEERFAHEDFSQPFGGRPSSDDTQRQMDEENEAKVAAMTPEERDLEKEELLARFGGGLVEVMRKRREQRQLPNMSAEPTGQAGSTSTASTESQRIRQDITAQNEWELLAMSEEERRQEIQDLEGRFGQSTLEALKKRAERRVSTLDKPQVIAQQPRTTPSRPPPLTPDDTSPEALKSRYFPNVASEPSKMAWLKPPPPSTDASVRFDLSGNVLSAEAKASIPTSAGLHHHGASPDLAGYTLDDVLWLSRSTVPSQQITMLGVLGRILGDYAAGQSNDDTRRLVEESAAKQKGVEMAVDILLTRTRAVGIIRAGIDLLYEALGGRTWDWLDADEPSQYRPDPDTAGLDHIRFDELAAQIKELLGRSSPLTPASIYQLIQVLRRAMYHSQDDAEAITPLVPAVIEAKVLAKSWPVDTSAPPSLAALSLLRESIESSRTCAEIVVNKDILSPLLRFLVPSTWTEDIPLAHQLARETLCVWRALARYGLAVSIVTSATDIIRSLGVWVKEQCVTPSVPLTAKLVVEAYFGCLTTWTVCAIDPHKTIPDHALTWTHASGLGWIEEALDCVCALSSQKGRWNELASVLSLINAHFVGAKINEPNAGQQSIASSMTQLCNSRLEQALVLLLETGNGNDRSSALLEQATRLQLAALEQRDELFGEELQGRLVKAGSLIHAAAPSLAYHALRLGRSADLINLEAWTKRAMQIIREMQAGHEPEALDLIDDVLRSDFSTNTNLANEIAALAHPDKLQILRPLLHYAILPTASQIVGPVFPSHLYLQATTTLRRPATTCTSTKRQAGLPLSPDWLFTPINELLESSTSPAFAQAPPDWDASELDIVQATLLLARAQQDVSPLSRSTLLLNVMKVFMLEHNSQASGEHPEAFRDDAVIVSLKALIGPALVGSEYTEETMEKAAVPFLGPDIPFYQFYSDFVGLYEAISYGDAIFSQLILPPLAMTYPVDFRKLLWVEQPMALRSIRTKVVDMPLEQGLVKSYLYPVEPDADVLAGYTRALIRGWVSPRTEALWFIATRHLAGTFWKHGREEKEDVRRGLIRAIMGSGPVEVIREIITTDLTTTSFPSAKVNETELKKRLEIVEEFGGEQLGEKVRRIAETS